jgi:hypothetical protein
MINPWENEPSRKEWTANGLKCLVLRVVDGGGHLCGYVAVPKGHPAYGRDYNELNVDVHGGLTFGSMGEGKYHPEGHYWLGFDCAHSGDLSPFYAEKYGGSSASGVYRDMAYVTEQTESLAKQLAYMGTWRYRLAVWVKRVWAAVRGVREV